MRNIILASLALIGLAATEARAAAPDTSRVGARPAQAGLAPAAEQYAPLDDQERYDRDQHDQERGYGAQYAPRVRVWLDNDRDILRVGERARVMVRTDEDAYVAVLHIDTNGDVEFLFPRSAQDEGYVRGGRTYSVPAYGNGYLSIRGGYGIGYVFAVASSEPLDTYAFRDAWFRSTRWDAERNVYGDPFFAMERFEEQLVRDVDYGAHTTDYYSYHVGRRYSYPRYACYDGYGSWYHSRAVYWDSCDRIRVLLVTRPYYYDTRYWRGDRRVYYRRWYGDYYANRRDRGSEHGYKDRGGAATVPPLRRQGSEGARNVSGAVRRAGEQERAQPQDRTRPTFGRRSAEPPAEQPRNAEPRYVPQRGDREGERRVQPPAERRSEPEERRSSPPPERRSEPRAERSSSPPPRVERSEPRRESSSPPRSSSGSSAPRSSGSGGGGGGSRRPN